MAESMMMGGEVEVPSKNDYIYDTISIGLMGWGYALIPVLLWWLYESKRPGMSMFDASNDWYYISWWAWWIGNLVAFVPPMALWIPAYFS